MLIWCPGSPGEYVEADQDHLFGLITNSAPTAFWLLYQILSCPPVLEKCRHELWLLVRERDGVFYLNLSNVPELIPMIQSTLREVLRFHGVQVSLRKVMEDHVLDDRILLKRGSALMMPAPAAF